MFQMFLTLLCFSLPIYLTYAEGVEKEVGVVVLPEPLFSQEAARMHREIYTLIPDAERRPNNFHITLFHVKLPEEQLEAFAEELRGIVAETSSFEIGMNSQLSPVSNQYVLWDAFPNPSLQLLHEKVLRLAQKFRTGALARAQDAYETLSPEKKREVDQFGVTEVLGHFQPHITLCYRIGASPEVMDTILSTIHPESGCAHFKAAQVALGELGYYGNLSSVNEIMNLREP